MTPTLEDLCHLLISAHVTVGFGDPHPYPGCYLWVDDENRIAYVGTSEDVKARVAWEAAAARRGELFPLAVRIRSHELHPLAVYVLEFSPRLAWARLVRELSFLDGRLQHIDRVLGHETLTPRDLEEFVVRSLALAGKPVAFNSQFGSAWHRPGDNVVEDLALGAAQHCLRRGVIGHTMDATAAPQ